MGEMDLKKKAAEADQAVNEAMAPSEPEAKRPDPQPTSYTFDVDWKSPQGRRYHGAFKARIMTVQDQIAVGILRSQLCGNVPPEALDKGTKDTTEMVATLTVVIEEQPDWSKDLAGLHDTDLVWAIYKEVRDRENTFRGGAGS